MLKSLISSSYHFYWLCFLIVSLAYELPIIEFSSLDRLNPRLFDVASLICVFFVLPSLWKTKLDHCLYKYWKLIVQLFVFCSIVWIFILPWDPAGKISFFYSLKYVQGLIVILTVVKIQLSDNEKDFIHVLIIICGVFIAIYCIFEYFSGESFRILNSSKILNYASGTLLGPLGHTYSHLTAWSALATAMSFGYLYKKKYDIYKSFFLVLLTFFISWPGFFSGSRSGLFLTVGILFMAYVYIASLRVKILTFYLLIILMLVFIILLDNIISIDDLSLISKSFDRLITTELKNSGNTIFNRVGIDSFGFQGYNVSLYKWQGWIMLLVGGGFYSVPHTINNILHFRLGYGIHNGYLFPLEQGGILSFFVFIFFLYIAFLNLKKIIVKNLICDSSFAMGFMVFYVPMLFYLWVATPVWYGSGTENLSTLIIVVLMLALKDSKVIND